MLDDEAAGLGKSGKLPYGIGAKAERGGNLCKLTFDEVIGVDP